MSIVPYGFASPVVRDFRPSEAAEVVPSRAMSVVIEDYVLDRGNPTVPDYWIRADAVITADGSHYTDRVAITDVNDDALVRFVPTEDTFDDIAFVWNPYLSELGTSYTIDADPLTSPVLSQIDYQIGRELFSTGGLVFDSNSIASSIFEFGFDDSNSLTIGFALRFTDIGFAFITFADGASVSVTKTGVEAVVDGHRFKIGLPSGPTAVWPLYVVLKIEPPRTSLTVGYSPARMYTASSPVQIRTTSLLFTLNGPLELYSLDLWGDESPSPVQIVSRYASALGSVAPGISAS